MAEAREPYRVLSLAFLRRIFSPRAGPAFGGPGTPCSLGRTIRVVDNRGAPSHICIVAKRGDNGDGTMQVTYEFEDTFVANVRGFELPFDMKAVPAEGHALAAGYGWQRILNDACGKVGKRETYKTDDEYRDAVVAAATAKYDSLVTGERRQRRTASTDSVKREAQALAFLSYRAALSKAKYTDKGVRDYIADRDLHEPFMAEAAEIVAKRAAALDGIELKLPE